MAVARGGLFLAVCAVLITAIANAEAASVVIGLAKCADCTRKNMKAEQAFKGLHVAIKCKNSKGEYESKAVGHLDATGAFSVPLADNLHGTDCLAQLHNAANSTPCPGQEPSKIVSLSEGTFGVVGGKTHYPSEVCASATLCEPIKKHIIDHFHKKPVPPKPEPKPEPKPKPQPDYHPAPPTSTYGGGHPMPFKKHIIDHFHKKPVPPKPEPKPQPKPNYHPAPPTPTYGGEHLMPFKKHIIDHFHKKPVPPKPEPKPEPKPQPQPDYQPAPPTPTYGGGHPMPFKKHVIDHFRKKPVPPKSEPKPEPKTDYHPAPPTPTYRGGHPTPIYYPPAQH